MMKRETIYVLFILVAILSCETSANPIFCSVGWEGEFTHIDPSLGQISPTRDDLPECLQALAWSPNGILYAGKEDAIYTINPLTGDVSYFLTINSDIRGMAFSPSGTLYITSEWTTAQKLRIVDIATGNVTDVGALWGNENPIAQGLDFSPNGVLYAIKPNVLPGTYELLTIDLDDAEMHSLGSYSNTADINQSIAFTSDGSLYALGADVFAQIDPINGAIIGTPIELSGEYRGLAFVPEPGTVLLLGLGGLILKRKRH
jgi:WD40 repeat protein